jgi:hypothetical protein
LAVHEIALELEAQILAAVQGTVQRISRPFDSISIVA